MLCNLAEYTVVVNHKISVSIYYLAVRYVHSSCNTFVEYELLNTRENLFWINNVSCSNCHASVVTESLHLHKQNTPAN